MVTYLSQHPGKIVLATWEGRKACKVWECISNPIHGMPKYQATGVTLKWGMLSLLASCPGASVNNLLVPTQMR